MSLAVAVDFALACAVAVALCWNWVSPNTHSKIPQTNSMIRAQHVNNGLSGGRAVSGAFRPQVCQGDRCFSWLAAFRHSDDGHYTADSPQTFCESMPGFGRDCVKQVISFVTAASVETAHIAHETIHFGCKFCGLTTLFQCHLRY